MNSTHFSFLVTDEIRRALKQDQPVVALESTVITHGLPAPHNLRLARDMEAGVRSRGAIPATVALLNGSIHIGLTDSELESLASNPAIKVSLRDFATALTKKINGGTTVAGTMFAAHKIGIKVFATGGIGGVHKESRMDISTDMQALATLPVIVVCAGAKSILDLPSTLELLETNGVPVLGYGTDEFPAFFSRHSGLKVSARVDSPQEVADFVRAHWSLGLQSGILVCQPISAEFEISREEIDPIEEQASQEAIERGIRGQAVTPFLLRRVNELSDGRSTRANISFLLNNARLAADIAKAMTAPIKTRSL
ncbi:MAG: Pseudouridine-5'-phosphate glycosidase [Anaerolineales bacterium]|nr:Pseudouridine-5'-phosphate glycosidase [Anaerolineales bacterium]